MDPHTQMYSDVIIGATEGGTGYWAYASSYHWSPDDSKPARVDLTPTDEQGAPTYRVTVHGVAAAMWRIAFDRHVEIRSSIREAVQRALFVPESADLDADDADAIVQVLLFGEIVYG